MSPILYVFIFLAAVLTLEALHALQRERRSSRRTADRLERLARRLDVSDLAHEESSLRDGAPHSLFDRLLAAVPGRQELALQLYRAGMGMSVSRFLTLSAGLGLAGFLAGVALLPGRTIGMSLAFVGLLPWLQVRRQIHARLALFERQLPEALDLLVRSLRAGHSLTSGLQMVGSELSDPIGTEFRYAANEIALGKQTKHALDNLMHRVPSSDLPFFVTAISIQQETGSNLAEVLENLSTVIRERFKVLGKVRAITAMGRMSANVLAIWPAVMIVCIQLVNPGYIAPLWETEGGHQIVVSAVVMIVIGYYFCRRLAEIRV